MADYMDSKEIERILDEYHRMLAAGKPITKEMQQQLKDAKVGIKNYSQNLEKSLKKFGNDSFKALVSTEKGASKYNEAISAGGDALSNFAMRLGPLGMVAGLAIKGITAYVGAVNKQADALYKSYQALSQTGLTDSGGMTSVFNNLQKFGLTVKELDGFTKLMAENSTVLARFGGTASQGVKGMAEVVDAVRKSDAGVNLRLLGMSAEDLAAGTLGYGQLQARLGRISKTTQDEMIEGGAKYAEELLKSAKLTGLSTKEIEDSDKQAVEDTQLGARMRQNLDDARRTADEKAIKRAEEENNKILKEHRLMAAMGPEMAEAYRTIKAGGKLTETGLKAMNTFPGLLESVRRNDPTDKMMDILSASAKTNEQAQNLHAIYAESGSNYLSLASRAAAGDQKAFKEREKDAKEQMTVTDKNTKTSTEIDIKQQNTTQALDSLVNLGIGPVTTVMEYLSDKIDTLLSPSKWFSGNAMSRAKEKAATGGGAAAGGGGATGSAMSQSDLEKQGLIIKKGDVQAEGASISPQIVEMAKKVQGIANFKNFTGFNDKFHNEKSPSSKHAQGRAMDFTLTKAPNKEEGAKIVSLLKGMGATLAIDEYNNPSAKATAGHFHAEISAAKGGIATGPKSGYGATLHGTEAIVPLPDNRGIPIQMPDLSGVLEDQASLLSAQLSQLDIVVKNMQNQLKVTTKIMQNTV